MLNTSQLRRINKMQIFKLEEYLTKYEFSAPYLLCSSDAESFYMHEILALSDKQDERLWRNMRLSYTEPFGLPELRQGICSSLYSDLKHDNILCFAGAEEGIFAGLHVLCAAGDHVIVLTPCYQSLLEIPLLKGAEVTQIALLETNNWRIDLDAIKKAIKSNTKSIVINFPHNPTGQVITQSELTDLVSICDAHDMWLFSDEVYRLLGTPSEPWAKPAAEIYPKAISLGVMSKAFGMAGLRIGWLACRNIDMLHKIKQMKDYLSICNSAPSEILSLIALKNKKSVLARNNEIVATNLALLDDFFKEKHDRFSWVKPEGGCVGFVHYNSDESVDVFCNHVIEKAGILLMPASIYNHPTNHFRIGFGRKNMPEVLEKFKAFLKR